MARRFVGKGQGKSAHVPWYLREGGRRLAREQELLAAAYPTLSWNVDRRTHWMRLDGVLTLRSPAGVPHRIRVGVTFPSDFPDSPPTASDPDGRLPRDADRHIYPDGSFCLWLPEYRPLRFTGRHTVVDFIDQVVLFLERQLILEATGKWPGEQWAHGTSAYRQYILEYLRDPALVEQLRPALVEDGTITRKAPCPCGSGKQLNQCHLNAVLHLQRRLGSEILRAALRPVPVQERVTPFARILGSLATGRAG